MLIHQLNAGWSGKEYWSQVFPSCSSSTFSLFLFLSASFKKLDFNTSYYEKSNRSIDKVKIYIFMVE